MCVCRKDSKVSVERVNFRQFVRTLARFRRSKKGHEHPMNSRDKKIECNPPPSFSFPSPLSLLSPSPFSLFLLSTLFPLPSPPSPSLCFSDYGLSPLLVLVVFQVYDTDRDGAISQADLRHILHIMVGLHIPTEQVHGRQCVHMYRRWSYTLSPPTAQLYCAEDNERGR